MVQNLLVACLKAAIFLKLLFLFYLSPLYCSSKFQSEKKKLIFPMEGKETKRADVFTRGKKTFGKKKEKWRWAQNWKFDSEWRKRVFRLAVSRVRCMWTSGPEIPAGPGDRMNNVNKKCALECTNSHQDRSFSIPLSLRQFGLMSCCMYFVWKKRHSLTWNNNSPFRC